MFNGYINTWHASLSRSNNLEIGIKVVKSNFIIDLLFSNKKNAFASMFLFLLIVRGVFQKYAERFHRLFTI